MKTRLVLAAAALLFGLHLAVSLGNPVGLIEDDAVQVMLARSLRHGGFALPDAGGVPVTDPLPGLALILLVPVWIVEPFWHALRAVSLVSLAAAVFFAWRLGQRLLPEPWPLVAAGLTALTPVLLRHSGFVLPDIPYLALTLAAFDLATLEGRPGTGRLAAAAALAALAALVRPHGALLALSLAAGLSASRATKSRAPAMLAALLPLGLWLLRNKLVAGVSTGYAVNWRAQAALMADPAAQVRHAFDLTASFFGFGLAGVAARAWLIFAAGAAVLLMAGAGAVKLLREKRGEPALAFSLAAYAVLVLALHMTWAARDSRYAIPLSPIAWLFLCAFLAGAWARKAPGRAARAVLALILASVLWRDGVILVASTRRDRAYEPGTMEWIRRCTGPGDLVESLKYNSVMLLTGRPCLPPAAGARSAAEWLAAARASGARWLHVEHSFRPGGFLPQGAAVVGASIRSWAESSPGVRLAFRSDEEGSSVFDLGRTPARR